MRVSLGVSFSMLWHHLPILFTNCITSKPFAHKLRFWPAGFTVNPTTVMSHASGHRIVVVSDRPYRSNRKIYILCVHYKTLPTARRFTDRRYAQSPRESRPQSAVFTKPILNMEKDSTCSCQGDWLTKFVFRLKICHVPYYPLQTSQPLYLLRDIEPA